MGAPGMDDVRATSKEKRRPKPRSTPKPEPKEEEDPPEPAWQSADDDAELKTKEAIRICRESDASAVLWVAPDLTHRLFPGGDGAESPGKTFERLTPSLYESIWAQLYDAETAALALPAKQSAAAWRKLSAGWRRMRVLRVYAEGRAVGQTVGQGVSGEWAAVLDLPVRVDADLEAMRITWDLASEDVASVDVANVDVNPEAP
jgi:hypothetical protein